MQPWTKATSGQSVACCGSCGSFLVDSFYEEILLMNKIAELGEYGHLQRFHPCQRLLRSINLSPFYGWRRQKDFWFLPFPESFSKCSSYSSGNGSYFVFLCDSVMHTRKGSSLLVISISITRLQHTDLNLEKNGLRCSVIIVQLIPVVSSETVNFLPWPQWCVQQQASFGGTRNFFRKRR